METLVLTGNTSDFTTTLIPPIRLNEDKRYEAALLSITMYNSIPNITERNNIFKYSTDAGKTWKVITLPKGAYELQAINDKIQSQMIVNGDHNGDEFYVTIYADISQLKSVVEITNKSYQIDFRVKNSIASTLGFKPRILWSGYNLSDNIVDITKINLLLVNVDIISGGYVNGARSPAIYSFDPNRVSPGYKLEERPSPKVIYYQLNKNNIDSVRLWVTDQDSNSVDVRGENISVKLHIREQKR